MCKAPSVKKKINQCKKKKKKFESKIKKHDKMAWKCFMQEKFYEC